MVLLMGFLFLGYLSYERVPINEVTRSYRKNEFNEEPEVKN